MKKLIAAATVSGLLVTGGAGVAHAADGSAPPARTAEGPRHRVGAALGVAAEAIGIERAALVAALRDGKSVADVATAHDVEPQAVVDALVAAGNQRIDTAVTNGRIDADRAATIKERLPRRAERLVNGDVERRTARHKARRHARRGAFALAATTIGVEPKELAAQVRDGKSVADVARDHDVEPQAVVDAIVTAASERIDRAVAKGRIDADRAAQLKERVAARVADRIERTRPAPRRGG
jgi:uncharacterized protein (DUF433 family)